MQPKSNWKTVSLKDLCSTLQSGGTPPRSNPHNFHGPYKWASVADLTKSNKFIFDTAGSLSEKGLNESTAMLFPANTILFAMYASIGECAIASDAMACSQAILGIQPNDKCNTDFLYYFLQSYKQKAKSLGQQGTQSNLNKKIVGDINVVLPPLVEQQKIASVLSDLDALIEAQEALIAKKRDVKAATMELLLTGKKRLPGFSGEWNILKFEQMCSMKSGETVSAKDFTNSGDFLCYGGNGYRGRMDRYTHDGEFCLIGRQGALCGNVKRVSGKFFASEHAIVVTPNKDNDCDWLAINFERMNLNQYAEASAQPGLSVSKLLQFKMFSPKKSEQQAISAVILSLEEELKLAESEILKIKQQKSAAMHKLLTGEIRLA